MQQKSPFWRNHIAQSHAFPQTLGISAWHVQVQICVGLGLGRVVVVQHCAKAMGMVDGSGIGEIKPRQEQGQLKEPPTPKSTCDQMALQTVSE